jgi:outer membrane protein, multidrug efflux system
MYKRFSLLLPLLLLTACSLAPEYERPQLPVENSYPETGANQGSQMAVSDIGWEEFFSKPQLKQLIGLALENNRDLHMAGLKVDRMSAILQIQRLALIPSLDATADGTRQRTPGDLSVTGQPTTRSSYRVGLEIPSYELDFFGRVASLRDQALQQYLSTEEALLSFKISLVSSVARQYFLMLAAYDQLELATKGFETAEKSFQLNQQTFDAGVGSELELRTAEAQMEAYKANVAGFTAELAQYKNGLQFLVGAPVPKEALTYESLAGLELVGELPVGLPSDLLVRRPDIRAAERNLQAANAYIGVARAAFFPSIKLTAFGGTASSELSGLFGDGSGAWSFAPSINLPIFASGRNQANLEVAQIDRDIQLENYEGTIQAAFREVSDALAVRVSIGQRLAAQQARVIAAQRRYELSDLRFKSGVDSFLPVLLAQQELLAAERSLVAVHLIRLTNLVSFYAALGGGFDEVLPEN